MSTTTKTETVKDRATNVKDEVVKTGRNIYLAGLGTMATAGQEARQFFDKMVDKGTQVEKSENSLVDQATQTVKKVGSQVEKTFQQTVSTILNRAGIPTRDEIRTLIERVEELNTKVEKLAAR
jgi:poly(hydroxyalkanoate) granule-associated protein